MAPETCHLPPAPPPALSLDPYPAASLMWYSSWMAPSSPGTPRGRGWTAWPPSALTCPCPPSPPAWPAAGAPGAAPRNSTLGWSHSCAPNKPGKGTQGMCRGICRNRCTARCSRRGNSAAMVSLQPQAGGSSLMSTILWLMFWVESIPFPLYQLPLYGLLMC